MLHVSTRGQAPAIGFRDAMLAGLARDGGLYWPERFPVFDAQRIAALAGRSHAAAAADIVGALTGSDPSADDLAPLTKSAYATFRHAAICPLVQIGDNLFVLELFHGPTLAFKDVAMQLLARLMDAELARRGQRATIVGATSGDTGSAAIEAFRACERVDVFILYPHGRVSEVQRRQMTTVEAPNVHAIAIDGTFDDCQALVKAMFNHAAFRDRLRLSGVNSINWARIAAQVVYYFTAAVALGAPHRPVSFSVPSGNFGNVLAGYVAKRMGLPVERFVVGTNENDILARVLATGEAALTEVVPTTSPSMDIQVSSNFERLIFEAGGRDAAATRGVMDNLAQSKTYRLTPAMLKAMRADFDSRRVGETDAADTIARHWRHSGYLLDPHTAIGVKAAEARLADHPATPVVVLGTAHPAKFPDAVERACGHRPALPPHLADLLHRRERSARLANDLAAVEAHIAAQARIGRERAA